MANEKENIIRKYIQEEIRRIINEETEKDERTAQAREEENSSIDNLADVLRSHPDNAPPEPVAISPKVVANSGDEGGTLLIQKEPEPPSTSTTDGTMVPEENEWKTYSKRQRMPSEYLENEWEHKSYLLATSFYDKTVMELHDLVLKELALSNLPDYELSYIYSVKMDCVEEFLSMGFPELAKQMLVRIIFRLRLLTSVEGLELIGQHGTSAISMTMDRQDMSRFNPDEEQPQKKSKLGLGSIIDRVKGGKK